MQLKRLRLRRFKAFETAEIEISPLTILIGPNNAGKSTVLQALQLLTQSAKNGQIMTRGVLDLGSDPGSLTHSSSDLSTSDHGWAIGVEWEAPIPEGAVLGLSGPARVSFDVAYIDAQPNLQTSVNVSLDIAGRTVTAHSEWPGISLLVIAAPDYRDMRESRPAIKEEARLQAHGAFMFQPFVDPNQQVEVSQLASGVPQSTVAAMLLFAAPLLDITQNLQSFHYIGPDRHVPNSVYSLGSQPIIDPQSPQQLVDLLAYRDDLTEQISQRMIEVFGMGVGTKLVPPQQISLVGLVDGEKRNVVNLGSGLLRALKRLGLSRANRRLPCYRLWVLRSQNCTCIHAYRRMLPAFSAAMPKVGHSLFAHHKANISFSLCSNPSWTKQLPPTILLCTTSITVKLRD
jgi:energy-coupling factor transporter ATP-binding protein EcfA2